MSEPSRPDLDPEARPTSATGVPAEEGIQTRAGYVTLAGRPNSGKSTLLNRLLGQKLSIATSKPQTTWQRITGIHTSDGVQMIFLDTPGLLDVTSLFQRSMLGAALEALREADVCLLVLDATGDHKENAREHLLKALSDTYAPILCAINKIDIASSEEIQEVESWCRKALETRTFRISALKGTGIEPLRDALKETLPPSPFLYPEDDVATAPVRFFVAELIRETVFEQFRQEVPYAVFCQVEEFREREDPVYIQANLYVERNSQKGILVGKKGAAVKRVGRLAREKVEAFLERSVYLDLWVKVLPGWRRKNKHLRRFGFRAPEDHEVDISS